jgi:hypothetical protein
MQQMDSDKHCHLEYASGTTKLLASRRQNTEGMSTQVFYTLEVQKQRPVQN